MTQPRHTSWQKYAEHLRNILELCGVGCGQCLPGEPEECGHSYADHCVSYLAALQAKAEDGLEHMHHGDAAGEQTAEKLVNHWRDVFTAANQCTDRAAHRPET